MKLITTLPVFLTMMTGSYGQSHTHSTAAKKIVETSMHAMGYEAWNSVQSLSLEGYGYQNVIDESERPEGPFIPRQILRSTVKDLSHNRFQVKQTQLVYQFKGTTNYLFNDQATAVKTGAKMFPTQQGDVLQDELDLSPELILKKALASGDLTFLKDTVFQKARHHLLFFRYNSYPPLRIGVIQLKEK